MQRPAILADRAGSMAVETALVAPVLLLMSLGGFEVSMMIARQTELQSAAAEAAAIVMAAQPDTPAKIARIESVVETSAGLAADQVAIIKLFRCGTNAGYASAAASCGTSQDVSTFLRITLTDAYTPYWSGFGAGRPVSYRVVRTVQLS